MSESVKINSSSDIGEVKEKSATVSDVVIILKHEPVLIQKWKQFFRLLGLDETLLKRLDRKEKTDTIEYEELFVEIVQAWVTKNKKSASVWNFILILRQGNFNSAADGLTKKFAPEIHQSFEGDSELKAALSKLIIAFS